MARRKRKDQTVFELTVTGGELKKFHGELSLSAGSLTSYPGRGRISLYHRGDPSNALKSFHSTMKEFETYPGNLRAKILECFQMNQKLF